jgi:hypothetical protein
MGLAYLEKYFLRNGLCYSVRETVASGTNKEEKSFQIQTLNLHTFSTEADPNSLITVCLFDHANNGVGTYLHKFDRC